VNREGLADSELAVSLLAARRWPAAAVAAAANAAVRASAVVEFEGREDGGRGAVR
jgi:hypothetical protein